MWLWIISCPPLTHIMRVVALFSFSLDLALPRVQALFEQRALIPQSSRDNRAMLLQLPVGGRHIDPGEARETFDGSTPFTGTCSEITRYSAFPLMPFGLTERVT